MTEPQETGTKRKIKFTYVISAIAISCLMIGTAFGMMISATTPTGFPTVIEPGSMEECATYVIFKDSGTTYVKNGSTGKIISSDTNSATIIQWAIDDLADSGGGTVFIKRGEYHIDSTLTFYQTHGIALVGEASSILYPYPVPNTAILKWSGAGAEFIMNINQTDNIRIQHISFDGNLVGSGIELHSRASPYVENRNTQLLDIIISRCLTGLEIQNATRDAADQGAFVGFVMRDFTISNFVNCGISIDDGNYDVGLIERGFMVGLEGTDCIRIKNIGGNNVFRSIQTNGNGLDLGPTSIHWTASTYSQNLFESYTSEACTEFLKFEVINMASLYAPITFESSLVQDNLSFTTNYGDVYVCFIASRLIGAVLSSTTTGVHYTFQNCALGSLGYPINISLTGSSTLSAQDCAWLYGEINISAGCGLNLISCLGIPEVNVKSYPISYVVSGKGWSAYGQAYMAFGTDNVVVTHGLNGIPTMVIVTGSSEDTQDLWTDTWTTTEFTIHTNATLALDNRWVSWYACYNPIHTG